ncbi:UDP-glucose dehydrogenase family protein [Cohnella zeiphila]|uniref:UDP-glucose 6-dehydrogenase n=1 Tax=Cohnella zeiphila TaxID=2761120 RepID=A0A7X0SIV5_9BACL|nr:UDP-glucose/GDP-mannose dehydrogenase family protein [Cohnella zeiphila]MBB6730772.1 UDP-glucose/GDP-mannose dehydrogenase family protein [Cohnella zeiphila]
MPVRDMAIIGAGYVGLVAGACYAELGNRVVCVDSDEEKIARLRRGEVPIYEPDLPQLIARNAEAGRLAFAAAAGPAVEKADIVVIAVGTPPLPSGEADLRSIEKTAREIGASMNGYKIVCIKSTVPVGTAEKVERWIAERYAGGFDVVSLPEFLREGSAVADALRPDRIVIGTSSERAAAELAALHEPLAAPLCVTDARSAEMTKYASNAFLATKITFINEIANLCEKVGADVAEVARGMGLDRRIGSSFLRAGIGYGGSCFPKDTNALVQLAGSVEYDFRLLKAVIEVNREQRLVVVDKLQNALGSLRGRRIGIWGLSFKPNTDDVREAPALAIAERLAELGAELRLYDPAAQRRFREVFDHPFAVWCESALEAARGSDALCLLTEWPAFADIPLAEIRAALDRPLLIDGRNLFDPREARLAGLEYVPVGRPVPELPAARLPAMEPPSA